MNVFRLGAIVLSLWSAGTIHSAASQASFTVTPSEPLIDEPVRIVVSRLAPNNPITLRAKSEAQDHLWWRSEIVINSGPDGQIDLGAKAPDAGSYRGIDAMGIFWSMKPDKEPKNADHSFFTVRNFFETIDTTIEVVEAGHAVGSVTIKRRYSKAGVKCGPLKDAGLQGILCYPDDGKQHPGVLVIGGSEGGIGLPDVSVLLASHGFAAYRSLISARVDSPQRFKIFLLNTSSERLIRCSHFPRCARDVSRCLEYLAVRKQHSNLPRCLPSSTLS